MVFDYNKQDKSRTMYLHLCFTEEMATGKYRYIASQLGK